MYYYVWLWVLPFLSDSNCTKAHIPRKLYFIQNWLDGAHASALPCRISFQSLHKVICIFVQSWGLSERRKTLHILKHLKFPQQSLCVFLFNLGGLSYKKPPVRSPVCIFVQSWGFVLKRTSREIPRLSCLEFLSAGAKVKGKYDKA